MNLLDLFILLPFALFAFQGFRNGVVREILTIAGVILAVYMAFLYMDATANVIEPLLNQSRDVAVIIAGFGIFFLIFILVLLGAELINKFLILLKLNLFNRILGMGFGIFKCGIVISAVLLLLAGFNLPAEETRTESVTYPYVIQIAPGAYNVVSAMIPGSERFVERIRNSLEEENPIQNLPIF